ncbi:MAG: hypothetical protein O3A92_07000 [Verrucomicrobia bacterium]|nr:hypothetical protein [Verrucomicrobiota bacterium]
MRLISLLLLALLPTARADDLAKADLAKLADSAQRSAEVARLAKCHDVERFLTAFEVLTAPQADNKPDLHVVTASYDYSFQRNPSPYEYQLEHPEELFTDPDDPAPGERLTATLDALHDRLLLVFDETGQEIRPFGGNNYIDGGYLFDFNHDGILDRADSSNHRLKEAPDQGIEVFELESVEAIPRTLLRIAFNWHPRQADSANNWGYTCFDEDGDGFVEIAFGPESPRDEADARRFVFRWDPDSNSYTDPMVCLGSSSCKVSARRKIRTIRRRPSHPYTSPRSAVARRAPA